MSIEPGLSANATVVVSDANTATTMRSGDVEVFATPALVALCEEAAVAALAPYLAPDETTVGTSISLQHTAPTPVGATVTAQARLVSVDGRALSFTVTASDGTGEVATGTHDRVRVDRERFAQAASMRT